MSKFKVGDKVKDDIFFKGQEGVVIIDGEAILKVAYGGNMLNYYGYTQGGRRILPDWSGHDLMPAPEPTLVLVERDIELMRSIADKLTRVDLLPIGTVYRPVSEFEDSHQSPDHMWVIVDYIGEKYVLMNKVFDERVVEANKFNALYAANK